MKQKNLKTKSGQLIGRHELLSTGTWATIDDAIKQETMSDVRLPIYQGVFKLTDPTCTTQEMCIALALNEYSL